MAFSYYGKPAAGGESWGESWHDSSSAPVSATSVIVSDEQTSQKSNVADRRSQLSILAADSPICANGKNGYANGAGNAKPGQADKMPAEMLQGHSSGTSFYKYGPPGTPHSDFVRVVSSNLPYHARPQRPGRTIQDWLVGCESVSQVLSVVEGHGVEFDCINTATALHRIARWNRESPQARLFDDTRWRAALGHVGRNLPIYNTRHLSGTLWSLATVQYRGPEMQTVLGTSQERIQEFTCVDLALTAWSIATLKIEPDGLYDEISSLSIPKIAEFQPQALANICWATATLKKENDALIRNAAMVAARHIDAGIDFRPHEYATIAWSMVLSQAREECLFHRISNCVKRRIEEFGPQELTNTVWAFAALGVKPEGLFEAIGNECRVKLSHFNTQNITNLAWSYTHLMIDSPELLTEVAQVAHRRIGEMNVQDLAQLALSLVFIRGHDRREGGVFGTRELTLSLVREVTLAMVEKLQRGSITYPDDAWIVHDLVLVWMNDETEAQKMIGDRWIALDGYVNSLFEQVLDFMQHTPLLRYAQPVGAVVQTIHIQEYERAFRGLDLRSLGIKYTTKLLSDFGLIDEDETFTKAAREQLELDHAGLIESDPGAGSQNWCLFRFSANTIVDGTTVTAEELHGIRVRSCGGDPVALTLLDPPFESHLVAVKLSNDRLNHRKRDAEFRAIAHVAGVLRSLLPDADAMMQDRIWWGKHVWGRLQMYVTEVPCLSCLGAMVQFTKRFPRVEFRVSYPGSSRGSCK